MTVQLMRTIIVFNLLASVRPANMRIGKVKLKLSLCLTKHEATLIIITHAIGWICNLHRGDKKHIQYLGGGGGEER
jgi:hypothetical protein